MLLVFLVLILVIIFVILNLKIKFYLKINNNKFEQYLKIFIFQIPLLKIQNKYKFKRSRLTNKLKSQKKDSFKLIKNIIQISKLTIEKLELVIDICTEDAILTSLLVFSTSNIIAYILKFGNFKIKNKQCKYAVNPLYVNQKIFDIELNCIISTNLIHTTYVVYKNYKKWRCDTGGRTTSNRKSNGNCYEQHKGNDRCKYNNR